MPTNLLERDQFLLMLDELMCQAAEGCGRTVLVSGEAGIGKTSVVECLLARHQSTVRSLWGTCEALFTPRPLGPLYDISHQAQTPLRAVLESGANRATLFAAVLDELAHGPLPTIVVFEDIHWADEATLDLVKFLARRIGRSSTLLILTYRDDELGRDHPLWRVLGDLPARDVTRLRLPPLSAAAVAALAKQAGRPADDLYAVTGGNLFFITEVLASDAPGVPTSVRDAVLTQVVRLSQQARALLELVAVVPSKLEWGVVEAVSGSAADSVALDECLTADLLQLEGGAVGFRHELARQALESALAPTRKRALHAQVLHALLECGEEQVSLARLVHHAVQAEDGALVLRFAPAAARQAAAQGAHREATAHYMTALRYADGTGAEQRAELLDGLAYQRYLIGRIGDAIEPCAAALAIWQTLGHQEQVGHDLRQLSRLHWFLGRNAEAERYAMEAIALLETLPPSRELAMAYGSMSQLRMLVSDNAQTLAWGRRAIELAERLHDDEIVSYALNTMGASEFCGGDIGDGLAMLERSLQLARKHGFEEHIARSYTNLADISIKRRQYAEAARYLQEGIDYCTEHDLDSWSLSMRGNRAQAYLDQGNWAAADEDAAAILSVPWLPAANRIPALIVLGLVRARRGDPGVQQMLDEARDLALATGEMQTISPTAAARAEWRWLQGNLKQCAAEAAVGVQAALHTERPWYLGEVAIWLWRSGGLGSLADPLEEIAAPFASHLAGDWRAAAAQWERLGCPYEQALALADGDEAAQRTALALFERLGARPAAELVRRQLLLAGVRGLPRGPRSATRANPQGLTNRQLEILLLLAEGLHNTEIAERLSTTPKTVEHHVSAVLAKLDARSRAEAVRRAHQLGLVPSPMQASPTSPTSSLATASSSKISALT